MLVEYTGRMLRDGKAAISAEVANVFARLGCTPETWGVRMSKLAGGRLLGRFLAATESSLRRRVLRVEAAYLIRAAMVPLLNRHFSCGTVRLPVECYSQLLSKAPHVRTV